MCKNDTLNRHLLVETIYELGDRGFKIQDVEKEYLAKVRDQGRDDSSLGDGQTVQGFVSEWLSSGLLVVRGRIFRLNPAYHE